MLYLFSTIAIAFANLFLGLITFFKNPKSHTSILMLLLSLVVSLWVITNYFSVVRTEPDEILFWIRMVMATTSWVGPILLMLANTFPYNKTSFPYWAVYLLLTLASVTSVLAALPYVFSSLEMTATGPEPQPGPAVLLYAFGMVGLSGASFGILIWKYFTTSGIERTRNSYFLLGLILSFTLMISTTFIAFVAFDTIELVPTGPLWSIILIISLSYAIIRHRFLDIRFVVVRSVTYTFLIIFVAALYSLSFFLIEVVFFEKALDIQSLSISVVFALIIALTFQPLLRIIEKATDKIFFKGRYTETELLNSLSRVMASTVMLKDLSNRFMKSIYSQMKISAVHIVFLKDNTFFSTEKNFHIEEDDMKYLSTKVQKAQEKIFVFDELSESKEKEVLRKYDLYVVMPLIVDGKNIGMLFLGSKASGDIYSSQDVRVLQIVAPELAVALRNALSYEEISNFNITLKEEVERATQKLKNANIRLRELDKQKDEFVSVASHELRTPMTAIRGYLWLALNKNANKLDPTVKHQLEVSYNSTLRLINLVNDMLTISRLEKQKIEVKREKIDILPIVMAVYEELKIQADEKNVEFVIEHDKDPYMLMGDAGKLRDVIQNLVGNALKFTNKGHVRIRCVRKEKDIQIQVEDTGPGIQKEDMDKLFGKFVKLEFAYRDQDNVQGTGLGLYITKKIVSLHRGDIQVESEVGKGTTFTVILPKE